MIKDGKDACRGITAQNLRTMEIEAFASDAAVICTGGNGLIFGLSTNSIINTGCPVSICYQQGVHYGNPEMVQIHPTAIPARRQVSPDLRIGSRRGRTGMDAARSNGRAQTGRHPRGGSMVRLRRDGPRLRQSASAATSSASSSTACAVWARASRARQQVYLDITQLHKSRGGPYTREQINDKLEGVLEIYEKFMREDPIETPMRIYPAVHYTMGGMWVDYETERRRKLERRHRTGTR